MLLKVPLLLGLIALEAPVCSSKYVDVSKDTRLFVIGVEFAMFQFNQAQVDEYVYKLLWVGRSQRKVSFHAASQLPQTGLGGVSLWSANEERKIFCFR